MLATFDGRIWALAQGNRRRQGRRVRIMAMEAVLNHEQADMLLTFLGPLDRGVRVVDRDIAGNAPKAQARILVEGRILGRDRRLHEVRRDLFERHDPARSRLVTESEKVLAIAVEDVETLRPEDDLRGGREVARDAQIGEERE